MPAKGQYTDSQIKRRNALARQRRYVANHPDRRQETIAKWSEKRRQIGRPKDSGLPTSIPCDRNCVVEEHKHCHCLLPMPMDRNECVICAIERARGAVMK